MELQRGQAQNHRRQGGWNHQGLEGLVMVARQCYYKGKCGVVHPHQKFIIDCQNVPGLLERHVGDAHLHNQTLVYEVPNSQIHKDMSRESVPSPPQHLTRRIQRKRLSGGQLILQLLGEASNAFKSQSATAAGMRKEITNSETDCSPCLGNEPNWQCLSP